MFKFTIFNFLLLFDYIHRHIKDKKPLLTHEPIKLIGYHLEGIYKNGIATSTLGFVSRRTKENVIL